MIAPKPSHETLAAMFKALGDPTRLSIFQTLACCSRNVVIDEQGDCRPSGSLSVGEVCCQIGGSGSTISHHLKELRLAGLLRMEKRGRWIYCSIEPASLEVLNEFLRGSDACRTECAVATPEAPCCADGSNTRELIAVGA